MSPLYTFELKTGRIAQPPRGPITPDGKRVAIVAQKGITLYESGHYRAVFSRDTTPSIAVFSPDRRYLAVGDSGDTVMLWDLHRRTIPLTWSSGDGRIQDIAFSPLNSRLALANDSGTVVVYDLNGKAQITLTVPPVDHGAVGVNGVAFDVTGNHLATAGADGVATIWNLGDPVPEPVRLPKQNNDQIEDVTFTPDGKSLMVVSDSQVLQWDLRSNQITARYPKPDNVYFNLLLSGAGDYVAGTSAKGLMLKARSSDWRIIPHNMADAGLQWLGAGFSHDGQYIAGPFRPEASPSSATSPDGSRGQEIKTGVAVWSTKTLKPVLIQPVSGLNGQNITTAVFDHDNVVLAVGTNWTLYKYPITVDALLKTARAVTGKSDLSNAQCQQYLGRPCPTF
jgi:WD40 repeat protein